MIVFFQICVGLFIVSFWSGVLAYVPVTFYLLVKNPPIVKVEKARQKGIFNIHEESLSEQRKKSRVRVVMSVYGICLLITAVVYGFNWVQFQQTGVNPFDILSTLSVILFWFSVLTYCPVGIYLRLKQPWRYKEEGVCLTGMFVSYGVAILLFSVIFAHHWLKVRMISVQLQEMISGALLLIFSAAVLAYLPLLLYVFFKSSRLSADHTVRSSVIFVIYSVCFVLFAGLFFFEWVRDHTKKGADLPIAVVSGVPYSRQESAKI